MSEKAKDSVVVFANGDARHHADAVSKKMVGVDFDTAWKNLNAGKYRGTVIEAELKSLNFLLTDE